MVDESVGGCILVRREATATGLFVVDLLLEQHRWLSEQLGEHVDHDAAADELAQDVAVVDELLTPCDHRAGIGLLEVVQPGATVGCPVLQLCDGLVDRSEFGWVEHARHEQPPIAPVAVDVDLRHGEVASTRALMSSTVEPVRRR
jgi:hypothetical protein